MIGAHRAAAYASRVRVESTRYIQREFACGQTIDRVDHGGVFFAEVALQPDAEQAIDDEIPFARGRYAVARGAAALMPCVELRSPLFRPLLRLAGEYHLQPV